MVWPAGCAVLDGLTCRLRCTCWSDLQAALYLLVSSILTWMSLTWRRVSSQATTLPTTNTNNTPLILLCNIKDQQPATRTSLSLQKTNFKAVVGFVNTCVPDWILQHVRNLCVQTRDILLFICLVDFLQYFELGDRAWKLGKVTVSDLGQIVSNKLTKCTMKKGLNI